MQSDLTIIPGIGKNIAQDLNNIGISCVADLKGKDPEELYQKSCHYEGAMQDRCLLYVYRLAVYYAENETYDAEKLKWWNWKDKKTNE